jgi:hypothetical protein
LDPSNEALLAGFKTSLKRWIENITPEGIVTKSIFNTPIICMTRSMIWWNF